MLHLLVGVCERDVVRLCEILPELMRCAGLQRLSIRHERLDRVRRDGAREFLVVALAAADNRQAEDVFGHLAIDAQHLLHFCGGLFTGRVGRMPFLPQELERAQERARGFLPAHDVGPLVDEHREIAVRLNPLGVHHAEHDFGRGADRQALAQLFVAPLGDPRDLRREALDVLGFAHEEALGNEQREVRVLMTGGREAPVELGLDQAPDRVAVRAHDDAAAHGRIIRQLRLQADLCVPLGDVVGLARDARDLFFLRLFHHGRAFARATFRFRSSAVCGIRRSPGTAPG